MLMTRARLVMRELGVDGGVDAGPKNSGNKSAVVQTVELSQLGFFAAVMEMSR